VWSSFAGIVVAVRDLATAEEAYASLLGRRPAWRSSPAGGGSTSSGFALANAALELRAPGARAQAHWLREWIATRGEGLAAIALATDDLVGCARALRGRGIAVGDAESGDAPAGGSPLAGALRLDASATRGIPVLAVDSARLPADAETARGGSVGALDHVVVASRDADASCAVWGGMLGLRLALDHRFEARGLRILFFRLGGVTVEVTGPLEAQAREPGPDAFFGAAWRVGDVDAARARVAAAGLDVSDVRAGHKPGTRVCTVRGGTHGVATLLIGPDPPAGAGGPGSATLPPS
jgi:catechol 2,3-dioxygenase-like lactoylglutathione lyase family enzyme